MKDTVDNGVTKVGHSIEFLVAQAFYRFPSHSIECLILHIARNIYFISGIFCPTVDRARFVDDGLPNFVTIIGRRPEVTSEIRHVRSILMQNR